MQTKDYDYFLPKKLIAQRPRKKRDQSRLLVVDRKTKTIKHQSFFNIIDYLNKDDVLVLNNSKVIPARFYTYKKDTKAKIEILVLKIENNLIEALIRPSRKVKVGSILEVMTKDCSLTCLQEKEEGIRVFQVNYNDNFNDLLQEIGEMPLPPYITTKLKEKDRYQTVYANILGSSAAPTAGLHFTKGLLDKINNKGVKIVFITLHVGLGTFRPIKVDKIKDHKMHQEFYQIDEKTAKIINQAKEKGNKIIAVGTTVARTLETVIIKEKKIIPSKGWTNIFIYPPYQFKIVDLLITNFHLPKSTLLMLVSAFSSKDLIMKSYQEAIKKEYYFFSFGDSMLIK
ncbi:MAG: tRNA preQ1(34) S-adenosylmethionine ribosyltransferase-isomerase QueA [Bacilli bacterium]|jgi:S-adenosylmethionine:tRNA ribosyltransferase-isomerase